MNKHSFLIVSIVVAFFGLFSLNSCQYNACKARAVKCENLGFCSDGECICVNGWEGDSCNHPINEKFDSYYAMIRTELINNTVIADNDDTLWVSADGKDRSKITFVSIRDTANFDGWVGKVAGNAVYVEEQTIGSAKYFGEGSLNQDVLTITLFKQDPLNNANSKTTYVGYKFETP